MFLFIVLSGFVATEINLLSVTISVDQLMFFVSYVVYVCFNSVLIVNTDVGVYTSCSR